MAWHGWDQHCSHEPHQLPLQPAIIPSRHPETHTHTHTHKHTHTHTPPRTLPMGPSAPWLGARSRRPFLLAPPSISRVVNSSHSSDLWVGLEGVLGVLVVVDVSRGLKSCRTQCRMAVRMNAACYPQTAQSKTAQERKEEGAGRLAPAAHRASAPGKMRPRLVALCERQRLCLRPLEQQAPQQGRQHGLGFGGRVEAGERRRGLRLMGGWLRVGVVVVVVV